KSLYKSHVGRSYWFECGKCGFRAKVSGRADRGLNFAVQTIHCRDCKSLYDTVIRLRVPDALNECLRPSLRTQNLLSPQKTVSSPPTFEAVLNRLPFKGIRQFKWLRFKPQCPLSAYHRVEEWNAPAKCPRCGVYLEQSAMPYRLWD